jgi:RNA polymerase sigma-70 factor (ECF subfamily)
MSLDLFTQRILPMKDKLFRFAFRLLRNVQEAEDSVQDVMVRVWTKKEEWHLWQSVEAYCMTAIRNSCLDRLRKKKLLSVQEENALNIISHDKNPYENMMNKEILTRIRKCVDALPENQQQVVHLREIEGFSYQEIAELLEMSLEQVKINLFRGRNAIKNTIIKEEGLWNRLG